MLSDASPIKAGHELPPVHRAEVAPGLSLGYVRAGEGGFPLVMLHGCPETKRIYARNIAPLAAAGFDVIVPDLRGFGDSDVPPDGYYDLASCSRDVQTLVHDVLGLERCVVVGGDFGGGVLQDLGMRFPGFVDRQVLFNSGAPNLPDAYSAAGVTPVLYDSSRPSADYFLRQGLHADALMAELDTPERRRNYVSSFYTHRLWAAHGSFTPGDVDFMTEPFADAAKLRACFGVYETACKVRPITDPPLRDRHIPIPTLVLYGADDHVVAPAFVAQCAIAFTECIGPFVVEGAGHFLPWEKASLFNRAVAYFCKDLAADARSRTGTG